MPDKVPYNQRHAHLFKSDLEKTPVVVEPFTQQLASEIPFGRYDRIYYGINNEELYAQRQSSLDQLANGAAKMAGTFTTSFLSGTVGLINGLGEYRSTGKFTSFYDNSLNRSLDDINQQLEDRFPNYYTEAEKSAEWYSPTNIFSANFFGDKVLKNLGYSFGALAGGFGWGSLLKGIGLTNKLVRAGQGLRAAEAVENAMANAPKLQKFGAINNALNSLWQSTKGAAGIALSNTERGIISATGMLGEATIESLQSTNDFRNKLIQDYKNLYGINPTGQDLDEINSYSESVGNTVFGSNALLLTLSNYIQLPKILGSSRSAEKRMINNIAKEGVDPTSKFVSSVPYTGNILSPVAAALGKPGRFMDKFILGPGRLTFSAGEAFEEGMQYAIQTGTQDYFDRASKNLEDVQSTLNGIGGVLGNIFDEGVRKALTEKEGLESILIGGFSGALQKGIQNVKQRGITGTGGIYGRNTQLAVDALNKTNIKQVLQDGVRYAGIAFGSQELRQKAIESGDIVNEKDYEKDFELAYILPRVKYGKVDSITEEVGYYRQQAMTETGFQELMDAGIVLPGETREKFTERLNSVEQTAKNVNKIYESLDEKYSGIMVDDKPVYSSTTIDKLAYSAAKIADYDGRIPSLTTKLIAAGIDNVSEIVDDLVNGKSESYKAAIYKINGDKTITDTQKAETVGLLSDVAELGIRRDKFIKDYNDIVTTPEKFEDVDITKDELIDDQGNEVDSVKIRTKEGDKSFTINKEYFAGSPIRKSKEGVEFTEFMKFTFLGTTQEGKKAIIRTADGKVTNVPIDVFEKYKIGDVAAVEKRPNAKFYIESAGQIFTYQLGGGKKALKGTIQYDISRDQLKFVTLDGKRTYLVDRSRFVAKEGYTRAQIYSSGTLTKVAEDALRAPITAEELAALYNQRDAIIDEVVNNNKSRLEEVNKNLEASRKELASVNEALDNVTLTKKGVPRKSISKAARKTINQLSDTKQRLEKNIINLEAERDELEDTLFYFNDILQYREELPQEYSEIIKELNSDVNTLEDLIDNTDDALKNSKSVLKDVEEALKKAFSLLDDFARRLAEENPNIPISVEALRDKLEKYLGEEGANQFINDKLGFTEAVMDLEEQITLFSDELGIPDLTKQAEDLRKDIDGLEKQLDDLISTQTVKAKLMTAFENAANEYKKRLEQEALIESDPNLGKTLIGTQYKGVQTDEEDPNKKYEPVAKKATEILWRATMGINRGKAHQTRANTFGFNFGKFENKDDIRGVYVTSKNEKQLVPGITDKLRMDEQGVIDQNIKKDEIIALVMVLEDENGKLTPVGVDGKPIPEGVGPVDAAIYQVFPDGDLKWGEDFNNESMFRKGTPDEVVTSITEQYKKWRASVLENPDITQTHNVDASFGRIQEVRDDQGNVVFETRTSIQDAGLATADNLESTVLLKIPTLPSEGEDVAVENKGTVTFRVPIGTVLLETPTGLVKLQNKQHTKEEAQTIFEAILQLSKYWIDPKAGMQDPKAKRLLKWLRSTVYWGIPEDQQGNRKPTGYNSIFFEENKNTGKMMLTISNKGEDFVFTPLSLEENKELIINMISGLYNNINSHMSKQLNEPYEEILSVSEKGEVNSRLWKNYQSYLLSNTTPDGKSRSGEQLPLSTRMRPLTNTEDVNRTDIYFFTTDTADDFVIPVVEKKKKVVPKVIKPGAPIAAPAPVVGEEEIIIGEEEEAPTGYVLDGKTPNVYTSPANKKIKFRATTAASMDNLDAIEILAGEDFEEVKEKLKKAGKDPKFEIKAAIYKAIAPQIVEDEQGIVIGEEEVEEDVEEIVIPEEVVEQTEKQIGKKFSKSVLDAVNKRISGLDSEALRVVIEKELKPFVPENWNEVEQWLKTKLPNVPVYRVKNIIQATNGRQAWGMFKDGAIYIYENAEVGTVYHEVFHAVWRMFADPAEQVAVLNEMRSRGGKFFDRTSMKDVSYSEATDEQLEEKLAEEFRDYVQEKKIPAKPAKGRPYILKLFADMVTAIKEFFFGPESESKVNEMFSKIGEGYYKAHLPLQTSLAFAKQGIIDIEDAFADSEAALSLVGISDRERSDIIQHMTYLTLVDIIKTDKSLFEVNRPEMGKVKFYENLKDQMLQTIAQRAREAEFLVIQGEYTQEEVQPLVTSTLQLMQNVYEQWDSIVDKHQEYLRGYQIEFDENDNLIINDENKTGRGDHQDATKIDNFKKTNTAVKLLLATIPEVDENGKLIRSSVGGAKLLPIGRTYVSLMNNLHTSATIEEMVSRLREMAENDPNYRTLYKRITKKDWKEKGVDLSNIKNQHTLQLLSAVWSTFKKQSPEVKNVFILDNGDVVVGEANLASAAQQLRNQYINSIVLKAKSGKGFFKYKDKVFKGDPASVANVNLDTFPKMADFLENLGIPFSKSDFAKMSYEQKEMFKTATRGIKKSIQKADKIATFSGKVLDIHKRLFELGLVKAAVANPEFSSTYFNIAGERTQTFIGTNAASDLYEFLSSLEKFNNDTVGGTRYQYLLTDSFSKYSNLLGRMFTSEGTRKKGTQDLFKIGYVSGTDNATKGKKKESSRLNYKERLVQELNLNLEGYYLNLVPGDASIEWMINMGNPVSTDALNRGFKDVNDIFKGYFLSELELARDKGRTVATGRDAKDMRFFKGILGEKLHADVLRAKGIPEKVYERFEDRINAKVEEFVRKDTLKLKKVLKEYNILTETIGGFNLENINLPGNMTEIELNRNMIALAVNYMIANIEMHKLLYSDPYQYEDELKRIKSFNSPRQPIISGSPKMNAALNEVWNEGYKPGDIGYTKFTQDYFRSATHADVMGVLSRLTKYAGFKETDGGGIINMKANRQFRIRAGNWNSNEERQYKYDIAWEKNDKGLDLSSEEQAIFNAGNPGIQSAYTPLKPIVSGNRLNEEGLPESYNNVVLDKFALYPLSYRIIKELNKNANALKLYEKMQKEDIDYVVFQSGRKVGAKNPHPTYKDGVFNDDEYSADAIINIPFSIMSIQAEVPSKEDNLVTRGSQITKLITLDFLEAGVPVDYMKDESNFNNRYKAWYKLDEDQKITDSKLYREIRNNQLLLEALIEDGYNRTLNKLGIKETIGKDGKRKFEITDFSKATKTLRDEILKREVNDNISDALAGFLEGKVVLEATVAYQQVRNILYSIADKEFISPKISGGLKVQIPSTLFEDGVREVKDGLYESDVLKFYEKDGKRVAEVMLGRWFDSPLSDEELLKFLNTTDEGQKILAGIGFRIPTQKQNSIDAIVVKKFLPKEFGDSVVVPAALVQKVGSDFDIDKLSVYLKNVYVKDGKPKLIPYLGTGEEAINKFRELYDKGEFLTDAEMRELERYIAEEKILLQDVAEDSPSGKLMSSIFGKLFSEEELTQEFTKGIPSKDQIVRNLYKKSLENGYIESMQNLVTSPENYENLIKPNSAESLKSLGNEIARKTVGETFDYTNIDNMLDRTFMSRLRHAFVTGKYAIGIAAVNQTNHSLNQRQPIYIDKTRASLLSSDDRFWLGKNMDIKFDKYNTIQIDGRTVPTLSMIKNKAGENISDIIGMFIDGYVDISKGPWIMELGATPNVASTWLFLIKLGVPVKTVAYFMNQPIISEYLRMLESSGYSWLFIDSFVDKLQSEYAPNLKEKQIDEKLESFKIPTETTLKGYVGRKSSDLNASQKLEQFLILKEFLKYAKMAEQLFYVTQGSNYDTSTFNDPYLVFKKQMQQIKAQNTIINSVDTLLSNSFIGELASSVNNIRDAFAQIIKSDSPRVRKVVEKILLPYINVGDRDFVKIAQKVVNDLFDWAVQTDQDLNRMIKTVMVNKGGTALEVMKFVNDIKKKGTFENEIIDIIEAEPSKKAEEGGVNNLKLNMGENKVYDQNNIIYAFRELRRFMKDEKSPLYDQLVTLSVLQSGVSPSSISFTSLLPYEDFENIYNKTLSKLEGMPNLEDFYELGVFQRNNWNNDDVVPYLRAAWIETKEGSAYNPSMIYLPAPVKQAVKDKNIPPILSRSQRNREANSDYIVYTWEENISSKKKEEMRKAGDTSYINKGLFKKVYDKYGNPFEHIDYKGNKYFVYKAINAWGDGYRANEFWDADHKSVINNGFMEVEDVADDVIINTFLGKMKRSADTTAPSVTKAPSKEQQAKLDKLEAKLVSTGLSADEIGELLGLRKSLGKEIQPKGLPAIKNTNQKSCG